MGGQPYKYVVEWQEDPAVALEILRQDVFKRGAYQGSEHPARTPDEALATAGEEGTCSILDIRRIGTEPGFFIASPLDDEDMEFYFGSRTPSLAEVDSCESVWRDIDRGTARYVVAYEGGAPKHIVFMGYSFD
jgi:hypothetical protein